MVSMRLVYLQGFRYNHTFILRVKGVLFDKFFARKNFNNSDQQTNRHLTYRFHGLRWNAKGDTPYEMIKTTLRSTLGNSILLVKRADKIKWLGQFLPDARLIDLT